MAETPYEVGYETRNPINLDYARPSGFRLNILTLPQVTFFCQSVTLPGLALGLVRQPTPIANVPWPGDKLSWDALTISFKIQSKFENYIELYNWFMGIGSPESNNEYNKWIEDKGWRFPNAGVKNAKSIGAQFSDAFLTVMSANNNPTVEFHFHNLFPTNLSGIPFGVSAGETDFLTAQATFSYEFFRPIALSA